MKVDNLRAFLVSHLSVSMLLQPVKVNLKSVQHYQPQKRENDIIMRLALVLVISLGALLQFLSFCAITIGN